MGWRLAAYPRASARTATPQPRAFPGYSSPTSPRRLAGHYRPISGWRDNGVLRGRPAALLRRLQRWAHDRPVRAKHTAVTGFRSEQRPAVDAVVKELAGIRRHGRRLSKSAVWAG